MCGWPLRWVGVGLSGGAVGWEWGKKGLYFRFSVEIGLMMGILLV